MSCCSAFMSTFPPCSERVAPSRARPVASTRCACAHARIRLVSNFIGQKIRSYWTVVNVQLRRTLMTTPVTAQGPAVQGISMQQQGFPPPLGIEQYLGQPQQFGGSPQQYGGSPQQSYMQPQFPGQQQLPVQQIVTSLVSQLLPIAQQVILPQVVAA